MSLIINVPWFNMIDTCIHIDDRKRKGVWDDKRMPSSMIIFSNIYTASATTTAIPAYDNNTLYCRGCITKKLLFGFVGTIALTCVSNMDDVKSITFILSVDLTIPESSVTISCNQKNNQNHKVCAGQNTVTCSQYLVLMKQPWWIWITNYKLIIYLKQNKTKHNNVYML